MSDTRSLALVVAAAAAIVAAILVATHDGSKSPQVKPVPHASTPAQEARNLEAWLKDYSN